MIVKNLCDVDKDDCEEVLMQSILNIIKGTKSVTTTMTRRQHQFWLYYF